MKSKINGRRYPWLEWFSQNKIKLYKDKHYNGLDHAFIQYVRRAAKRYGYIVSIECGVGSVEISVLEKVDAQPGLWNIDRKKEDI